ncbi:MAG: hypothetical protein LBR62_00310 [Puniceicoccales bacterium]|jgi:hypothetical protein|nr:hypothetical protein [Puniceicoccales bacterium]
MKNYKRNLLLLSLILSSFPSSHILAQEKTGRRKPLMNVIPPAAMFDDGHPFQTGSTRKKPPQRTLLKKDSRANQWMSNRRGQNFGWEEADDPFAENDDFADNPAFDDESSDY